MANLSSKTNRLTKLPEIQSPGKAGFLQQYAGSTPPSGWLECNGQAVSRTAYADLFANIGTTYGVGDGSTTFNLPNGPRRSGIVDVSGELLSATNGGAITECYAYAEQDLEGNWFVTLYGQGTKTSNTTDVDLTFNAGTFNFLHTVEPIPSYNQSAGTTARIDKADGFETGSNPAAYGSWYVKINNARCSAKPGFVTGNEQSTPIIKAYNDAADGATIGITEASATAAGTVQLSSAFAATSEQYGLVLKNRIVQKAATIGYGSSQTGLLSVTNVPDGVYRVTVGADYAYVPAANDEAFITPQVNGSDVSLSGASWSVGCDDDANTSYESYIRGICSVRVITFSNGTNSFDLDITITGTGQLGRPYYILEKLENVEVITTEWD